MYIGIIPTPPKSKRGPYTIKTNAQFIAIHRKNV